MSVKRWNSTTGSWEDYGGLPLDLTNRLSALEVRVPGGWTALTLGSGWVAYTSLAHTAPQWRREGDLIRLRGAVGKTAGATWTANGAPFVYDSAMGPVPVNSNTVTLSGGSTAIGRLSFWGSTYATSPGVWELAVSGSTAWMALDGATLYWPSA